MKNKLYVTFLAVLCASGAIFAQGNNTNATTPQSKEASVLLRRSDTPNYTLPQNKSFAHWSIGLGVGTSIFDGDIREDVKRVVPSAALDYTLTGNIERTFNPVFGFGLGYAYIPYGAEPKGTNHQLKGIAHETDFYLSINMANLFYRSRPQRWGVFFNVGMGMAFYNAKMTDRTTGEVVIGRDGHPMDLRGGVAWVWPVAGLVEYNLSKYWALGLKAEYRLHDKDNMEGYVTNVRQGNWNDAFQVLTLTVRYKPHFGKAYHVRNLSYGDPSLRDVNRRLAEMENMIKNIKTDTCCNKLEKLEKQVNQKVDTAFVEERIKAVARVVGATQGIDDRTKKTFNESMRGIQFETARADIKPVSYPILDRIVTIMKENPKFDLEIIGHTDNQGNPQSNLDLSDRRAHAVRTYLMDRGIESFRLTSVGKGETTPVATNTTPEGRALNRRVEFVVKQDGRIIHKSADEQQ